MKDLYISTFKIYFILLLVLAVKISSAAVIYTDVKPDSVNGNGQSYALDLDHNGLPDIIIFQFYNSTYNYNGVSSSGLSFDGGATYVSHIVEGASGYSKKIAANNVISGANTFTNSSTMSSNYNLTGEEWNGVTDGYLGVQFLISGVLHYGWVRLDVASNGTGFTIKDYAYESNANTQILAGAGIIITSTISIVKESANIIAFDNIISLKEIAEESMMTVFNSFGVEVYSAKVNEGNSSFTLNNISTGIYIVNVSAGKNMITKKIHIQL